MRRAEILGCLVFLCVAGCCHRKGFQPTPPPTPAQDVAYSVLDARQTALFLTDPAVDAANPSNSWTGKLDVSQRVQFAGGTQAIVEVENAHMTHPWRAIATVSAIKGSIPNASSEEQFHIDVTWNAGAEKHFQRLRCWTEHIAILHAGQYGYQENRDGNPFLGLVVLFNDSSSTDPNQPSPQFHIGFRSFFGHYEPVNGDIADPDNFQLYQRWYGPIGNFVPPPCP